MANHPLSAGIRRFVFGTRNLCSTVASRASTLHAPFLRKLKSPKQNPLLVLQNWVDEGNDFSPSQFRSIARTLVKSKRYHHALELFKWIENQKNFRMIPVDHAMKLELIIENCGLMEAEEYFMNLPDSAAKKAACLTLLRGYVRYRDTTKAEALMMKLYELGLVVSPHPFNEMMKLYLVTCDYRKVPLVIQQMKRNKIPCNVLSYNLWMNACSEEEGYGIAAVETVFRQMQNDKNVEVGWSSLATLANVYKKAGQPKKAIPVLKDAEKKLSTCKHLGYFFLITLYASLKDKEGVLRLWEASKAVDERISCANYICILTCLVKLGDVLQAERVFSEWESNCQKYDIRVSNVLLGAYVRDGLMEKAESLHLHTLQKGGCPNYKTMEILVEGYVNRKKADEAFIAMKRALAMTKNCHWRPPHGLVLAIAEILEKDGNLEYANNYITDIHNFGLASLPLYKILLRMHLYANKPPFRILKMMDEDKIEMDDETHSIVKAFALLKSLEVKQ
ncbi:pentatricopeptide repeat-containing protein At5g27460 [Vigna radiata var. radiata]|uniref:Pentatricopeptide repeat-containing protein At5g27460 n=1 Tax=Vigna radiata var. radiata TaxID=3916 RepID=A0A1S3U5Z9_VIGRR|nr:pentatricopeptide repeat-containing protein At5g27460 [Vigna radiata var. radiata]XP_014501451.1 pentatricopeptide repeat-containing protein At5g27460 [Vigna radiata var. radiata]XP_014501452.1 pentatricopeptide repeat-containing protein At5g27460 [Vigna radiata var. radiata]XP_014501453.1 pentatricopeptide repeat-containing protein At5g27460 [Vigna radiata var. radiata]XP_022636413.1 pentatricopeptide repeat-containing protein At5g27460 [Vigna radiata var. radiata]